MKSAFRFDMRVVDDTDEYMVVDAYGREIQFRVSLESDECGQFKVAVVVDGRERWAAHFTDRSPG